MKLATSERETQRLLSIADIIRLTGLSRTTIYRAIHAPDGPGKLTPVSGRDGRKLLFEPDEVERWLRER